MKPASTVGACLHAVLLLGALHLCGAAHAGDVAAAAPHVLKAVIRLDDGTHLQVQEFPGHSKWAGLKHYFTAATVHVQCPGHKASMIKLQQPSTLAFCCSGHSASSQLPTH